MARWSDHTHLPRPAVDGHVEEAPPQRPEEEREDPQHDGWEFEDEHRGDGRPAYAGLARNRARARNLPRSATPGERRRLELRSAWCTLARWAAKSPRPSYVQRSETLAAW